MNLGDFACVEGEVGKGGRTRCGILGDVLPTSMLRRAERSNSEFTAYLGCAGLKLPVGLVCGDTISSLEECLLMELLIC